VDEVAGTKSKTALGKNAAKRMVMAFTDPDMPNMPC
jgi:hypothetical protein